MNAPSTPISPARGRFFVLDGVDGCGKSTQARRLVEALASTRGGEQPPPATQVRVPPPRGAPSAVPPSAVPPPRVTLSAAPPTRTSPSANPSAPSAVSSTSANSPSSQSLDSAHAVPHSSANPPLHLPTPLHLREPGSTALGEKLRTLLLSRGPHITPRVETLLFAAARAQMLAELVEPALAAGRHVVCERFHPSTFAYQAVAGGLPEREVLDLLELWAGTPKPDLVIVLALPPEVAARRRGRSTDRIEDKGLEFQRRVAQGYARYAELATNCVTIDGARDEDAVALDVLAEVRRALR
jgi:dTMP kinase